jgi:hypothetical protein
VGLDEQAGLVGLGVGERAALVTEQVALQQVSGMAAQLTATNGRLVRGLWAWMARATSSLPVPTRR